MFHILGRLRNPRIIRAHFVISSFASHPRPLFTSAMTPPESLPSKDTKEKKLINLLRGWPSPHVLPSEPLKVAANKVLSDPDVFVPALQYGADSGYQPLREELSKFLGTYYDAQPDAERICITGGASQSVACILQSFTEPVYTKAVWAIGKGSVACYSAPIRY